MALDMEGERRNLVGQLQAVAKPGGNPALQAYAGSPYPVLGLSTPQMRAILARFWGGHRHLTVSQVNALAAALWSGPTFEEKALAIAVLARYGKVLDDASWRLADSWVDRATGWALSDGLASGPIAAMVRARPARFRDILRWTRAKQLWRRRASTYALHDLVFAGDLDKPFALLEKLLGDEEFWVQRAVGTWLRECWKKDRRRTEAFLRRHARGLPPVVITVATERAPRTFRQSLRRLRKARDARGVRSGKSHVAHPRGRSRDGRNRRS